MSGWYLKSLNVSQSLSSAKSVWFSEWGSVTISNTVFTLNGEPIAPGTSLTESNWTAINVSDSTILNASTPYWVKVISYELPPNEPLLISMTQSVQYNLIILIFDQNMTTYGGNITIHHSSDDRVVETIDVASPQVEFIDEKVKVEIIYTYPSESLYMNIPSNVLYGPNNNGYAGVDSSSGGPAAIVFTF